MNITKIMPWSPSRLSPPPVPSGSLIVVDSLAEGHADEVCATAIELGFAQSVRQEPQVLNDSLRGDLFMAARQPNVPADLFRQLLACRAVRQEFTPLRVMSRQLEDLREQGLQHCAVNLSVGQSQASIVEGMYLQAFAGSTSPLANYARAFGLDRVKLLSSDPTLAGPERARLQQQLIDLVQQSLADSPSLALAKRTYDQSVTQLEQHGNSVVVAASNEGSVLDFFLHHAYGHEVRASAGFCDNVLANSETTTVGACEAGGVADYSSDYPEVDLYANGRSGLVQADGSIHQGTSFAAPRVAAVMAKLHGTFADLNSKEVECLIKEHLCSMLPDYQGKAIRPALDENKSMGFLSRYC